MCSAAGLPGKKHTARHRNSGCRGLRARTTSGRAGGSLEKPVCTASGRVNLPSVREFRRRPIGKLYYTAARDCGSVLKGTRYAITEFPHFSASVHGCAHDMSHGCKCIAASAGAVVCSLAWSGVNIPHQKNFLRSHVSGQTDPHTGNKESEFLT